MRQYLNEHMIIVLLIMSVSFLQAQSIIEQLQPRPKTIEEIETVVVESGDILCMASTGSLFEIQASNYFERLLDEKSLDTAEDDETAKLTVVFRIDEDASEYRNNQHYRITINEDRVIISSTSVLGLIYGAVTFSGLVEEDNEAFSIRLCNVDDYPLIQRRIFSALPTADNIERLLDFALKNKIETLAIASRVFPWYEVSDEYLAILDRIHSWKNEYGAPNVMQMHNVYEDKEIVISDKTDIDKLKNVIKVSCDHGITKTMICADDTPPFKYGEGYILPNENDLNEFAHLAEALTFLMNNLHDWAETNNIDNELYFVPPFYTYEDMYYGEMDLYKNTPWEEEAFKPLYRDLNYIGTYINPNISVIWTGPYVRSRRITNEDILDWTHNLNGVVPFLWDNTIYSLYPFSTSPMFTSYDNEFPNDFYKTTGGNGMFINGNLAQEDTKVTAITTNDYLWSPENYNPEVSLEYALTNLYDKEIKLKIDSFKEIELNIRRKIGERQLWFDADTLWTAIRKVKKLTTKNPFRYHYNYTRMKALRLQLKYSVPEPIGKESFANECLNLLKKRAQILSDISKVDKNLAKELESIAIKEPDFNNIQ